ncbi:hypothetical protein EYF80_064255 [Liparis tanakae]|uniref:Uncharacterized protein n=1 Tax=Liparis tanakae TaxID=230148 RepID=A0A4Z2EA70_9TELE|nr:hypothetical protein EYF80_064255 [Liparis tanakae]
MLHQGLWELAPPARAPGGAQMHPTPGPLRGVLTPEEVSSLPRTRPLPQRRAGWRHVANGQAGIPITPEPPSAWSFQQTPVDTSSSHA